jgi:hypothetical protein
MIIIETLISEAWFAENGHLMLEICHSETPMNNLNKFTFCHGDMQSVFPDSIDLNHGPFVLDLNEHLPEMVFNPTADSLLVFFKWFGRDFYIDRLRWGDGLENDISSLLPGQSIARSITWHETYWGPSPVDLWVKDAPPTPDSCFFEPVARSVVKVKVVDQQNNPVPYVNCYNEVDYQVSSVTDARGEYTETLLPGKLRLTIKNPITNEYVYEQYHWLEPNETKTIQVQIELPAQFPYSEYKGLHVFPAPFNPLKADRINFRYYGKTNISSGSFIKLYDTKGRFVEKVHIPPNGIASWKPTSDIPSGMYLARIVKGNRIIDTKTFVVVK